MTTNEDPSPQPIIGIWAVEFKVPVYEALVILSHPSQPGATLTLARCSSLDEADAIVERLREVLPNAVSLSEFFRLCLH